MAISSSAESICYHIGFPWMIVDFQIVIFYQLQPSSLPEVEVELSEDILEALVICENLTLIPDQVMPLDLEGVHHCC